MMRATVTFHGPDHLMVEAGSLWDDDHPVVVAYGALFEAADHAVVRAAASRSFGADGVVDASSRPGRKRV
jgi:hypothetical protein